MSRPDCLHPASPSIAEDHDSIVKRAFARPALFIYAGIGITLATTAVTIASRYEMRLDAMAQAHVAGQNLLLQRDYVPPLPMPKQNQREPNEISIAPCSRNRLMSINPVHRRQVAVLGGCAYLVQSKGEQSRGLPNGLEIGFADRAAIAEDDLLDEAHIDELASLDMLDQTFPKGIAQIRSLLASSRAIEPTRGSAL
ncbi:hypothetical protein ACLKMY_40285 [Paraburkholderia mimosarum]|uniref:hypothetical protein n=1 Tax=Paraburkholderia mimosarum TaxID=312026 RepID=UPI000487D4DD|nr:hypothetical protein [Paraburkholderia mimosarum]